LPENQCFFFGWGSSPALNLGGKLHSLFEKGKKLDVDSIFLGKLHNSPCYRREKSPDNKTNNSITNMI
jgi:hypothetical protein